MRRKLDLWIMLLPGVLVLGLLLPDGNVLRLVLALPLVLILPGYALSVLLFAPGRLQRVERVLVSLGLSIALTILVGFALNWTASGMNTLVWTLCLGGLSFVCSVLAAWRNRTLPAPARARPVLDAREAIVFALAGVVALLALFVATRGAIEQPSAGFSQLWLVPAGQSAVQIGVSNLEQQPMSYRLVLKAGGQIIGDWSTIELQPGETWNYDVTLPATPSALEALLYRSDLPDVVYRRVAW